jgi:hypothetical protein
MNTRQVTLNVPEPIYRDAEAIAQQTGREIADVLTDTLGFIWTREDEVSAAVQSLSDPDVLKLADSTMSSEQDTRFSELLSLQQESALSPTEATELQTLLNAYQTGLLRKAQAIREAVRRGLREPLAP